MLHVKLALIVGTIVPLLEKHSDLLLFVRLLVLNVQTDIMYFRYKHRWSKL